METTTKTSIALEHFRAGRLPEALALFATFRMGFTREERAIIARAHEIMSGNAAFYAQLGMNTHEIVCQARRIIAAHYL